MRVKIHTLGALADYLDVTLQGDADYKVSGLATLSDAGPEQISFFVNARYRSQLSITNAGCLLIKPDDGDEFNGNKLLSSNPYLDYAKLSALFAPETSAVTGVHSSAVVDQNISLPAGVSIGAQAVIESGARLSEGVVVGAGCYVGANVSLGKNTRLHANVTIHENVSLGENCIIHSGAVIGADGFGFAPSGEGWQKIYQLGSVILGDDVDIGANTTVDRGALSDTIIGSGVKIDNQVQIAHNVRIGDFTAIAAATAIAGSTVIGKRCTIAGCVGIVGHIEIVDDVHITGMSMVSKSIHKAGSYSSGIPMNETVLWRKNAARFNQLDQLARELRALVDKKSK